MPQQQGRTFAYDGSTFRRRIANPAPAAPTPTNPTPTNPTTPTETGGAQYRPIRLTSIAQLRANLRIPASTNLVMWPYTSPRGAFIWDVVQTLGPLDALVLPEATESYLVDTDPGFVSDTRRYFEMVRVNRGLIGMGPGTVIEPGSKSGRWPFSAPRQLKAAGWTVERMFGCSTDFGYYGNFELRARDLGGIAYHGICHNKPDGVIERVYGNGGSRGFRNSPGGESGTFGFNGLRGQIYNCEIDQRDHVTRQRVGSSPYMFNRSGDIVVQDVYAHHAVAGMPTCWNVVNGKMTRVRSEFNGSGSSGGVADYEPSQGWGLAGSCFNFELCSGTFDFDDCTFICNYQNNFDPSQPVGAGSGNVGAHIGGGTNVGSAIFTVRNSKIQNPALTRGFHDWGSDGPNRVGGPRFDIQWHLDYAGLPGTQDLTANAFRIFDATGAVVPFKRRD
jgi:hypothetical protein